MKREQIHNNPYYYWWAFLRESDRSKWSAEVERDFGPVHDLSFEQWWEQCYDLFDCLDLMKERGEIADEAMIDTFTNFDELAEGEVAIRLQLGWPKKEVIAAFERLLQRLQPGGVGRPKHVRSDAEYPLFTRPDVPSLHACLQVYKAAKASPDEGLALIGERLGFDQPSTLRYHLWAQDLIENVQKGVFPKHR